MNERERKFEKRCEEKEKDWKEKDNKLNKKMEEYNEFQKEKTVYKTVEKKLNFEDGNKYGSIRVAVDYNYKGEKLNEISEANIVAKPRPNNYLSSGYGNNPRLLPYNNNYYYY